MAFNFNQSIEKVNFTAIKSSINYRTISATLLVLIALPLLLLASCSHKDSNPQVIHVNNQMDSTAAIRSPVSHAINPSVNVAHQDQLPKQDVLYSIDSVDYYSKNYYFANERINLSKKVTAFIKKPPLTSNPRMYKRFKNVKADFYKVRKYRRKLDDMMNKHKGRNNLLSNIETKRQRFFETEAKLFYQLERMVHFAEQSYLEWHIFRSHNAIQLNRFEKESIYRSEKTADLFEDFSFAVTHYTSAPR